MKGKISIYNIEETIQRAIDVKISGEMAQVLGLSKSIYTVFSPEDRSVILNKGITGTHNSNDMLQEFLIVDSDEIGEEDAGTVMRSERYNQYDLLTDHEIDVFAGLLRRRCKRTLKLSYYTKSKTKARTLVEKIRSFDIYNSGQKKHKLEYSVNFPPTFMHFINHVRRLKNKRLPKEDRLSLPDYINKLAVFRLSRKNTTDGTPHKFTLSYRENVYDVVGMMNSNTYDITTEKEYRGYWKIDIEYSIWYQKPTAIVVKFPLLIWNTPVSPKFSKHIEHPIQRAPVLGKADFLYKGLYEIGRPYSPLLPPRFHGPLNVPRVDDFENYPKDAVYQNVCSLLLIVEEDKPFNVTNIKRLPGFSIKDTFLRYILTYPESVIDTHEGLFQILLYRNNKLDYKNRLIMDKEGNITTTYPMDIKSTYRLVLRVIKDVDFMSDISKMNLNKFVSEEIEALRKKIENQPIESDARKIPYEKHFLKHLFYVDEFGNIMDHEGYLVYTDGTRIIDPDTGSYILGGKRMGYYNGDIHNGTYIDIYGRFISPDGIAIGEDGHILIDQDGKPITGGPPSYITVYDYEREGKPWVSEYEKHRRRMYQPLPDAHRYDDKSLLIVDYFSLFNIRIDVPDEYLFYPNAFFRVVQHYRHSMMTVGISWIEVFKT